MFIEYYYNQNEIEDGDICVIYKERPKLNDTIKNLTYTSLFKLNNDSMMVELLYGRNDIGSPESPQDTTKGIHIYGMFDKIINTLNVFIKLNEDVEIITIENVEVDKWYGIIYQISNEFNQQSLFVYSTEVDSTDSNNIMNFNLEKRHIIQIPQTSPSIEFDLPDNYYMIKYSNVDIANIRLFKTNVKEEDHSYVLGNLFVKNESDLVFIDNCRPRLNAPFIVRPR
jgi:hypothetical protein